MHLPIAPLTLVRQALRRLARERGFTATVLFTLALCIGANVAIFAVVDAILVRSLPFPAADRLVIVRNSYPGAGADRSQSSLPNYYDRREHLEAFASTSIHQRGSAIVGPAGSPLRIERDRVSPEFFATLGVPLALGRTFTEDEMLYANAQVLIITHEFWRDQFGGAPDVLGRELLVDGLKHTVVGVLPPKFRFLDSRARFFIPLASNLEDRAPNRRHSNNQQMIVRLGAGVSVAEAQAQMDALNEVLLKDDPFAELVRAAGFRTFVTPLHADTVREVRPVLVLLQAGVLALLLIGGVNLVNLLLIRASGRAKEFAVRQALGAGQGHLVREIVVETLLLAVVGGALGLALGAFGIELLAALGTDRLPLGADIALDARVAGVALGASVGVGLVLALPVVVFNLRRDLAPVLHAETRGGTVSRAAQRVRHGFIVAQIALAFVLLSGAGLLGLSLRKVLATSPGFQTDRVLTASVSLPWKNYPDAGPRLAFLERLLAELRRQPGVSHAGFCGGLPFSGSISDNATTVEGVERAPGESLRTHYVAFAMGEYWQALGIPLIEGRLLEDADNQREQRVCVVDQAFAQRYWPGQSALGRRIVDDVEINDQNAITIVGVVGTVKQKDLTDPAPLGTYYTPYKQRPFGSVSIVLRTAQGPEAFGPTLRRLVLALDPELPVDDIRLFQERLDDSLVARRSPAMLVAIFASVALVLAAIGTYGVLAYAVNQRRREIGVRMALGAQPGQVLQQFLGLGARLLVAGIVLGAGGAWIAGSLMRSVLYDVAGYHAGVAAATAGVMIVVVLVATLLPSQRAARVSPIEALRDD
ncbi:MAG: ABC transporter permease [Opitutaceae bacterium]|nr:ABC transporter permease [Opitutaceae bacterium]